MTRSGGLPVAALALFLLAPPVAAHEAPDQPGAAAKLHVNEHAGIGRYLVDQAGMSLYLFEADTRGTDATAPESTCYESCARTWPPIVTEGEPQAHEGVEADLLGTVERREGDMQVTYDGWPLYYFVSDQSPGHVRGHDVEMGGGEWYLVTPGGEKAGEAP